MALDIPLPWLTHPNASEAISSGASTGVAAARTAIERDENSARLAQEALQHNQQVQMEGARLSQQEHLANMEMQARKEISEQNRLREDQKLAIDSAYHTAQIGIAKGRLNEQAAIANAKAQDAALRIKRERDFGAAVASGVPVMEAYQRFPVSPSVLNAIGRTQAKDVSENKLTVREGRFPIVTVNPKTGETKQVYTPPETSMSKGDVEDLKDLRHERDAIAKKMGDNLTERISPTPPAEKAAQQQRLTEINQEIDAIKHRGRGPQPPPRTEDKTSFGHPKVGDVRAGYRFKGGDPSDQNSWELVNEGK
jgi:hypothetical protein